MPATPSAVSASLTASSLSGRTIALISFTLNPRSSRVHEGFFAVGREIDTNGLVVLGRTQREDRGNELQQDERQHTAVDDGGTDGNGLGDELAGIAEQESIRDAVQALLGEDAR